MIKTAVAAVAVIFCIAYAHAHSERHEAGAKFTKHFNDTLYSMGQKGQVTIEVLLDEKEYRIGEDVIGIAIHDSHDEDVEGAKLVVMVTGVSEPLEVTEKGGGLYLVSARHIPREGVWELSISVKKKKIEDGAIFSFPEALSRKMPAGKYDAERLKTMK